MIGEMTMFYHDCLDRIFKMVDEKQTRIQNCLRLAGDSSAEFCNDPFRLYQGYIEILKPIDYENDLQGYRDKIKQLEFLLQGAEDKSNAIQSACEQYLKEEAEIKAKLKQLTEDLRDEKVARANDVFDMKRAIDQWQIKYETDVN